METSRDGAPVGPEPGRRTPASRTGLVSAAGYLVLFVLGVFEAAIGSFQYSRPPSPVVAIVLAVLVLVTCAGFGWAFGRVAASLVPAAGWILTAFVLASGRPGGSVIITATAAGECFLYGGALACVAAVVGTSFARLIRPRAA